LELVFRRSVQKCGCPTRVYFDNGAVYRSHHIAHIVARLGIDGIVFAKVRRPMGHGKIEAFNRMPVQLAELGRLADPFFGLRRKLGRNVYFEADSGPLLLRAHDRQPPPHDA
jgi:transposase InsO family protein